MSERQRLRACAKINWALEVLGRRADGYHEVRTVLQTIAWWDEIDLDSGVAPGFVLQAPDGWTVPTDTSNLAVRAGLAFSAAAAGSAPAVAVRLVKHVPAAAGLGGGSADAAAVLRGLDRIAPVGVATLHRLATALGSDVPFFLRGGTQLATGRGEVLTVMPDAPTAWLVLLTPPLVIERKTVQLYSLLGPDSFSDGAQVARLHERLAAGAAVRPDLLTNAFDRVADAAFPDLPRYRQALIEHCGHALLCGAGPALFAIAAGKDAAVAAAAALTAAGLPARAVQTASAAESTNDLGVCQAGRPDILQ